MTTDKFTIPALTPSNYSAWATQIEHILAVQGVWEVVSGDENEPQQPAAPREDDQNEASANAETPPAPSPTFEQDRIAYKAKVAKANAIIFSNMSQPIVEEHKKHKVPSVLWETLQKRYAPRTTVSRISAGCDFANARMNDSELVPEYLVRLQRLRDRFAECGGTIDDAMYKGKMFEGLPEGYHALEANVKINGEDVSPEEVKDHILEHYRLVQQRSNAASGTSDVKAYSTQYRGNPGGGKFSNGNNGGNAGNAGGRGKNGKSSGGIFKRGKGKGGRGGPGKGQGGRDDAGSFCKKKGHSKKDCLKFLWYTTQTKPKDENNGNGGNGDGKDPGSASGDASSTAVVNYNWKQVGNYPRPYAAVT